MKKERKQNVANGTTYHIGTVGLGVTVINEDGSSNRFYYPPGTLATVVGTKRRREGGVAYTNYVIQLPDGRTCEQETYRVERQVAAETSHK
jgi:hypothetical protein